VPIDHGASVPVPGLENPASLIAALSSDADGFVVNYGLARACRSALTDRAVCLRADVYKPGRPGNPDHGAWMVYGAADALRVGAKCMMHMLYPHHPDEARQFRESARLIGECHAAGLPVITESLPFGLGRTADYTPENISFAVRAAAELGADIVKTAWPGDREAFRQIVSACFVPVIVLGGAAANDDAALLGMVADAMDAGAAGIAIGRNVWQHPNPPLILRRLHAVVHERRSAADALTIHPQPN
jgi:class I fructose-bisphosphate aldolase/fructose-bisphosphate aldolase/2-amino-3,7-dideoxy-D-threo-hept-6-ulosonate synthase